MKKILVIGSLNADFSAPVDHVPQTGETILAGNMIISPGGKGANQAYAAARLGGNVVMLGAVGKDPYGEMLLDNLKNVGADVSRVMHTKDAGTGMAWIVVDKNGDNSIIVIPGANMMVDRAYIDRNMDALEACDVLVLQLEIPLDTVCYAAKCAHELGKTIVLDPAPAVYDLPKELLCYVDITKPNETELGILTGTPDIMQNLDSAADKLLDKGVGCVIATLGACGTFVKRRGESSKRYAPRKDIHAVDSTAAGDSFTAALAVGITHGDSLEEAVITAMRTAEIVVTRHGAQRSIPTADEVAQAKQDMSGRMI